MHPPKVVLVSTKGYLAERDEKLLQELLDSRVELFCAVGVDAEQWEDALDSLCVRSDGYDKHFIATTAHTDESLEEVVAFAEQFSTPTSGEVEVLHA
jgi:mRNA deadenylase 3'-5' endonuclease subunit Ccr4